MPFSTAESDGEEFQPLTIRLDSWGAWLRWLLMLAALLAIAVYSKFSTLDREIGRLEMSSSASQQLLQTIVDDLALIKRKLFDGAKLVETKSAESRGSGDVSKSSTAAVR